MNLQPAIRKGLGPRIAIYRHKPLRWRDALTLVIPGMLAVGTPLAYGAQRARYAYANYGPVAAQFWSWPWFLLAMFALLAFAALVIRRWLMTRRYVAVHKYGLLLGYSSYRRLRWRQLAGISTSITRDHFLGLRLRSSYHAILYPNVGKPIHLDDALQNTPELITRIKASLYPRLLPELRTNFQAGQWLHFGPLAIQSQALRLRDRRIPWSQVRGITIQSGYLMVELENQRRRRLPVSQIPNVEILLQLVHSGVKT